MNKKEIKNRREFIELCCLYDYFTKRRIDWWKHNEDLTFDDLFFTLDFLREEQDKIHKRLMDLIPIGSKDAIWYFSHIDCIISFNRKRLKEILSKGLK